MNTFSSKLSVVKKVSDGRRRTTDYADNTDKVVTGIGDAGSKAIDLPF
jgi:hypothetical protein